MPIFVSMAAQYENLGDELINGIMLNELCARDEVYALRAEAPDWYIKAIAKYVQQPEKLHLITSKSDFISKAFCAIKAGQTSRIMLSCGHHPKEGLFSHFKYLALYLVSSLPSVDVAVVGASIHKPGAFKRHLLT